MRPTTSRFDLLPRARPSVAFNRTDSQSSMKDKFFLNTSGINARTSQPQIQSESLYCGVCNHRKPRCLCWQFQMQSQERQEAELKRTQSFVHHKQQPVESRRVSMQTPSSFRLADIERENQAINEAHTLARQSNSITQSSKTLQAPQQRQSIKLRESTPPRHVHSHKTNTPPRLHSESTRSRKSKSPSNRSHRTYTPPRLHSESTRSRRSKSPPNRSHRTKTSPRLHSEYTRSRKSRSPSNRSHRTNTPPRQVHKSRIPVQVPSQRERTVIDYDSSSEDNDPHHHHPSNPEIRKVPVTKTSKIEKFLQKNAMLKGEKGDPTKYNVKSSPLRSRETSRRPTVNHTDNEREMRYSVALDTFERVMSMPYEDDNDKERVKIIKRKNNDNFLFDFPRESVISDNPKVDYTKRTTNRVIPIENVWKEMMVYYLATFRGNEIGMERQLKNQLKDYDYLPQAKFIRRGEFVKYIPKSFGGAKLQSGGFVEKCTKHSIYIKVQSKKRKKLKLNRHDNFIFVYRYDDLKEPEHIVTNDKSNFRIVLEGLMKNNGS